jgi:stress response protein SCP2
MTQTTTRGATLPPVDTGELVARTLRVPLPENGPRGDGEALTRQLDVALMRAGFKLSGELFLSLSGTDPETVAGVAVPVVQAAKRLVGAHRRHNPYFINFPADVPDTQEFWLDCLRDAVEDPEAEPKFIPGGSINLLSLPRYGRYQHTYEEMLAAHEQYVAQLSDRMTVLACGGTLREESHRLYLSLAASSVPLTAEDALLLTRLAKMHARDAQPEALPVRENRALINSVRIDEGVLLLVTDPGDVLRLARVLAGADPTAPLTDPVRFGALTRPRRRLMIAALEAAVREAPEKIADVLQYTEQYKQLGERLHPHEYAAPAAQRLFAVARGDEPPPIPSLASRFDLLMATGDRIHAAKTLSVAPGRLMRAVDYLLRAAKPDEVPDLLATITETAPDASLRVLLSLREHALNRAAAGGEPRIFVTQGARAWVVPNERAPIAEDVLHGLEAVLDAVISQRLPAASAVTVQPGIGRLALPLSGKGRPNGIGVLPRGSVIPVTGDALRFFVYWKEATDCTDYDLSTVFLDANYELTGQVSWTNLRGHGFVHSGDLVTSAQGATEFIDARLATVEACVEYVVPSINVYSGEGFDQVEEAFFGYMERSPEGRGRPFEPQTVRSKSDLAGGGRVAMPLVFARTEDGWEAKWMHLNLRGMRWWNATENNRATTSMLARAILTRQYLTIGWLAGLIRIDPAAPPLSIAWDTDEAGKGVQITPFTLTDLLV